MRTDDLQLAHDIGQEADCPITPQTYKIIARVIRQARKEEREIHQQDTDQLRRAAAQCVIWWPRIAPDTILQLENALSKWGLPHIPAVPAVAENELDLGDLPEVEIVITEVLDD